ncbi:ribonuclease H-like domain-containing protein [Mycena haematopus]|nr:ribonuclease H-like domain-containing protein [Mycena haematopus]
MSFGANTIHSVRKALAIFRPGAQVVPLQANSPPFPIKHKVHYIFSESQANDCLHHITAGAVGFDTEFVQRRPTIEEQHIITTVPAGGIRKAALLGWQIVELKSSKKFQVAWDNIGVRLIQIAEGNDVWVLDMWKIRAFPEELRRILQSPYIAKVGVGLINDIGVIWDDLRTEMRLLVDVGMMAKLLLAEKYPKQGYGNMSLKTSVEDILGFTIVKDLAQSDWATKHLTDEQKAYAALDSVAALRLYEVLTGSLEHKCIEHHVEIPEAWYKFNTKLGEPSRLKRAWDGTELVWKTSDCTWLSMKNNFVTKTQMTTDDYRLNVPRIFYYIPTAESSGIKLSRKFPNILGAHENLKF